LARTRSSVGSGFTRITSTDRNKLVQAVEHQHQMLKKAEQRRQRQPVIEAKLLVLR
jgi:hypothetical protein